MTVVCAWCGARLREGADCAEVSHGICPCCAEHFFGRGGRGQSVESFLNRLPAPVLLVDGQGVVLSANAEACQALGKDLTAVQGHRGGEVIECAHARLPGGCGATLHCDGCTIRRTILATHGDGISRVGVEASLDLGTPDGTVRMLISITTEKVADVVLLRIDELGPAGPEADC